MASQQTTDQQEASTSGEHSIEATEFKNAETAGRLFGALYEPIDRPPRHMATLVDLRGGYMARFIESPGEGIVISVSWCGELLDRTTCRQGASAFEAAKTAARMMAVVGGPKPEVVL